MKASAQSQEKLPGTTERGLPWKEFRSVPLASDGEYKMLSVATGLIGGKGNQYPPKNMRVVRTWFVLQRAERRWSSLALQGLNLERCSKHWCFATTCVPSGTANAKREGRVYCLLSGQGCPTKSTSSQGREDDNLGHGCPFMGRATPHFFTHLGTRRFARPSFSKL